MEINNLKFSYEDREPWIIDDLTFKVEKGNYLTVLGENGSAKSTLIRLLLGLLKSGGGTIKCNFKNIGYVPQKKENFNMRFPITVKELLKTHIDTYKSSMKVKEALELVNMEEFENKLFGSLSGGQQQRVLIARALSSNPDLVILDEPLTGIDLKSQEVLRQVLEDLNKNKKLTIISIEHDVAYAVHNSTHILTLKEGKGRLYTNDEFLEHIDHNDMDNYLYHHKEVH